MQLPDEVFIVLQISEPKWHLSAYQESEITINFGAASCQLTWAITSDLFITSRLSSFTECSDHAGKTWRIRQFLLSLCIHVRALGAFPRTLTATNEKL